MSEGRPEGTNGWFDALSRGTRDGVVLLGDDAEVTFANPAALRLFGCESLDELVARWRRLAPELGGAEATRREEAGTVDVELDTPVGERRLTLDVHPIREDDCSGQLVLLRDRDVVDALVRDLRRARGLRRRLSTHASIAREARTPLNAMTLNLDLLRTTFDDSTEDPELDALRKHYVELVERQIERIGGAMDALADPPDPDAGRREPVPLGELLGEVVDVLRPLADRAGVSLLMDGASSAACVAGEREPLKQALLNASLNGLEAVSAGDALRFRLSESLDRVIVEVDDDGPGIPPAVLDRVFEPYFTTRPGGAGLGLFLSRLIVEGHGGEIEAVSRGSGTRIRMALPRAR